MSENSKAINALRHELKISLIETHLKTNPDGTSEFHKRSHEHITSRHSIGGEWLIGDRPHNDAPEDHRRIEKTIDVSNECYEYKDANGVIILKTERAGKKEDIKEIDGDRCIGSGPAPSLSDHRSNIVEKFLSGADPMAMLTDNRPIPRQIT